MTGAPLLAATERAARVKLMIFDVDGVLTDGRLYFGPGGEALKVFDVRDGLGVKRLHYAGVATAILSSRSSEIVALRARELGIVHLRQGVADKAEGFARLLGASGFAAEDCGFMGDDLPDLPVLATVGFAAAVADAVPEVRAAAHWVAQARGGRGAVRELAEFVLRAQRAGASDA
ncbi:MAG: HAD hydrolase family protein [Burkholderiales bacterium]|jgi:3-deoxy-D-manno-octulosonate 8-phosphate phosphatase (KDO 8-P phosphatase)|nr:HAD hydrolase family protein [Burkholderiales bacterium]